MKKQAVNMQFGLGWYARLLAKFILVAPLSTLTVLACSLLSQAFLLLAYFLPLKVILLVGSPSIPRYFPESWAKLPKDELVLLLASAAVFFFVFYQLAEYLISFFSEKGSALILTSGNSMPLFEQQNELALKAYNQYIRAISGLIFCISVIVLLLFLYPKLAALIAFLGVVLTLAVFLLVRGLGDSENELESYDRDEKVPGSWLTGVGFLVVFSFIIFELMNDERVKITIAVIGLLLARQFFQKHFQMIGGLNYVNKNASRVSSIFLHHQSDPKVHGKENVFWSLIKSEQLQRMAESVLGNVLEEPFVIRCLKLFPADMPPVIPVLVDVVDNQNDSQSVTYLIKIFGSGKKVAAKHEATLLSESLAARLPQPGFIGAAIFGSMNCNVFRLSAAISELKPAMKSARYELLGRMLLITPELELRRKYVRSHPLLHQRFNEEQRKRILQLASVSTEENIIRAFVERLEEFKKILAALPLQIVNPEISTGAIWSLPSGMGLVFGWSRWAVEPVGAGWPADQKGLEALAESLVSAKKSRKALNRANVESIQLAALLYEIEQRLTKQQYSSAISLMSIAITKLKAGAAPSS